MGNISKYPEVYEKKVRKLDKALEIEKERIRKEAEAQRQLEATK